jgi:hypothetical protein
MDVHHFSASHIATLETATRRSMPAPRVTAFVSAATATVKSSNTDLTCVIDNPSDGVNITEAAFSSGGVKTEATVAGDGQSFQVPIATPGNYIVGVTVSKIVAPSVNIVEDSRGGPLLLALFPGNVAKNGTFTLQVTV